MRRNSKQTNIPERKSVGERIFMSLKAQPTLLALYENAAKKINCQKSRYPNIWCAAVKYSVSPALMG